MVLTVASCIYDPLNNPSSDYQNPADDFIGNLRAIELKNGFDSCIVKDIVLHAKTPENYYIRRHGKLIKQDDGGVEIYLEHGLKDGKYELLYLEYELPEEEIIDGISRGHIGITCRIAVENGQAHLIDKWNEKMRLYGSGTTVDTLRIGSYDKLIELTVRIAESSLEEGWKNYYFLQTADIDGATMSTYCSRNYGWIPIGYLSTAPFRSTYDGGGYKITGLRISRNAACGVGLFGYAHDACIRNVHLVNADISGDFAVGGIVGSTISSKGKRQTTIIESCTVEDSNIKSHEGGYGVGGILGCIDENTITSLHKCHSINNNIYATMNAGGIVGVGCCGSALLVGLSENSSSVTSDYGCAGGIIGVCDTLNAAVCYNLGPINGAVRYIEGDEVNGMSNLGAGGITGGSGTSIFTGCVNKGSVTGREGVGGILGSTRLSGTFEGEDYLCLNAVFQYCGNSGTINGENIVGGICGEAQVGGTGCYNSGAVNASESYAGGIIGTSPLAVFQNNVNAAPVNAKSHAAGIAGVSLIGIYMLNHNYGNIHASSGHSGGILGYGGRDITLNYCGNFGRISSSSTNDPIGGLIAECGDYLDKHGLIPDWAKYTVASVEMLVGIVGLAGIPLAYVKPATAAGKNGILAFSVISFTASTVCWLYDDLMNSYGIYSALELKNLEDLSQETKNALEKQISLSETTQKAMRNSFSPSALAFSSNMLTVEYPANVQKMVNICATDQNNEAYCDSLQLSKVTNANTVIEYENDKYVKHQIVSGVAMLFGAVATIAGGIALAIGSGGTAIPAVVASVTGAIGAIMGGVNTIVQTAQATDYNYILIEESYNGGDISCGTGNPYAGGLVGVMHDHGNIVDCLNSGKGPGSGGHLVGKVHSVTNLQNSLSIAPVSSWSTIAKEEGHDNTSSGLYYCTDSEEIVTSNTNFVGTSAEGLTITQIGKKESFAGWDIDGKSCWTIPKNVNVPFPIPNISKYAK